MIYAVLLQPVLIVSYLIDKLLLISLGRTQLGFWAILRRFWGGSVYLRFIGLFLTYLTTYKSQQKQTQPHSQISSNIIHPTKIPTKTQYPPNIKTKHDIIQQVLAMQPPKKNQHPQKPLNSIQFSPQKKSPTNLVFRGLVAQIEISCKKSSEQLQKLRDRIDMVLKQIGKILIELAKQFDYQFSEDVLLEGSQLNSLKKRVNKIADYCSDISMYENAYADTLSFVFDQYKPAQESADEISKNWLDYKNLFKTQLKQPFIPNPTSPYRNPNKSERQQQQQQQQEYEYDKSQDQYAQNNQEYGQQQRKSVQQGGDQENYDN